MKKTIATVGILSASLVAYFAVNQKEFVPAPLDFNGTVIEMTHTDDNSKEDLIIYTDKATYSSWDTAEVIFSVTNLSDKGQNVTKRFLYGKTEQTDSIEEYIADVPYIVTIDDYAEKETCEMLLDYTTKKEREVCSKKKIGSHEETRYEDMWVNTYTVKGEKPSDYDNQERIGKVLDSKYKTDSESTTFIESGETKYYRAIVKFEPPVFKDGVQEPPTEFYIEATGDLGAFGNLDPWYSGSWTYRKQIDINPNYVAGSADHTSFPVLIDITDSNLASNAQSDGDDILFTSSDGTTKLDHEIEIYTTGTGRLTAHVRVPTLSYNATTTLYMYYGNSGASNQQNATGVWDSNYKIVYHLNDNAASTAVNDSTSNNNDGTSIANTSTNSTTGKIGTGLAFNGTTDRIARADSTVFGITNSYTYSLWVQSTNFAQSGKNFLSKDDGSNASFGLRTWSTTGGVSFIQFTPGFTEELYSTFPYLVDNSAYLLTVTYDGSTVTFYGNGASKKTYSDTGNIASNSAPLTIGANGNGSGADFFAATFFDEVRLSDVARSADWVATEYNNQSATTTFQIYGAQETDTGGGGGGANITSDLIMFE